MISFGLHMRKITLYSWGGNEMSFLESIADERGSLGWSADALTLCWVPLRGRLRSVQIRSVGPGSSQTWSQDLLSCSPAVNLGQVIFFLSQISICWRLVTESCLTLWGPMDYSVLGSSVHGISQARVLEWVADSFSRGSSQPRDRTQGSCIGRQVLYRRATREATNAGNRRAYFTAQPSPGCISW